MRRRTTCPGWLFLASCRPSLLSRCLFAGLSENKPTGVGHTDWFVRQLRFRALVCLSSRVSSVELAAKLSRLHSSCRRRIAAFFPPNPLRLEMGYRCGCWLKLKLPFPAAGTPRFHFDSRPSPDPEPPDLTCPKIYLSHVGLRSDRTALPWSRHRLRSPSSVPRDASDIHQGGDFVKVVSGTAGL